MEHQRVAVIGVGRLGCALVASFEELGFSVQGFGRDLWENSSAYVKQRLESMDVLSLCVQDEYLPEIVDELCQIRLREKLVVFHSGPIPLTVLDLLVDRGACVGKLHPLMAFSRKCRETIPKGTHFALSGSDPILKVLRRWVESWSGISHCLSAEQWLPYHLAAVLAANFLPLMIRSGVAHLAPMTQNSKEALDWLKPLINSAVFHALDAKNPKPYSGPAVRGDWAVIEDHLKFLESHDPQLALVYRSATQLLNAVANDTQKESQT